MRRYRAKLKLKRKQREEMERFRQRLQRDEEIKRHRQNEIGDENGAENDTVAVVPIEPSASAVPAEVCDLNIPVIVAEPERGMSVNDVDVLREKLRLIATKHKHSQASVTDLLKELQLWFPQLPSNARTLLATKTDFKLLKVAGGDYIHISIRHALPLALKYACVTAEHLLQSTLQLQINIDGVQLTADQNISVWPILGKIIKPVQTPTFAIGVYGGRKKPANFNEYLSNFVDELKEIAAEGGIFSTITNCVLPLEVINICCDAPARGNVRCVRAFNFRYGCDRCLALGQSIEHRMTFANLHAPLRQDSDFCSLIDSEDEDEYRVSKSILRDIGIGMVSQFPYDYMHLVCLGVVRSIATMMHVSEKKYRSQGKLNPIALTQVCEHMAKCASRIPAEFQRHCRTLFESKSWKATESRQFLLYTGPVVLARDAVPSKQYEHFLLLSVAIRCLCSPGLLGTYLQYAKEALFYFVQMYGDLYGDKFVGYNVHSLIHLADDAKAYGVLDNYSCFEYENFLGLVKELTHKRKTSQHVQQICRRLSEREFLLATNSKQSLHKMHGSLRMQNKSGNLPPELANCKQYRQLYWDGQLLALCEADNCILLDGEFCLLRNIVKQFSTSDIVTLLYHVFAKKTDFFTLPLKHRPDFAGKRLHSSSVGIWKVSQLNTVELKQSRVARDKSIRKCVLLPTEHIGTYVAFEMTHTM